MPPAKKKPAAADPKPKLQSKTRERSQAARAALKTSKGEGGLPAAAAVYAKKRHDQNKVRRARQKEATEQARVRGEQQRMQAKATRRAKPLTQSLRSLPRPRTVLLAELVICLVIVWAGALVAPQGENNGATRAVVKTSGLMGLFLVLSLVASAGKGAQKAAAGFGALVTVAYCFTSGDAVAVARWAAGFWSKKGLGSKPDGADVGGDVGTGTGAAAGGGAVAGALGSPLVRGMQT